jgi:hypothetical protein
MVHAAPATAARMNDGKGRKLRTFLCLLLMLLSLVAASAAGAEKPGTAELRKAEAAATEARVFFKAGLFDKASGKFMEAYAISKRPSMMFNAARAYEEGQNFREAMALLKHYRDLEDVGSDGKRDADERIARMEAILRQHAVEEADKAEAARVEAARIAEELQRKRDLEQADRDRLERERQERERLERERLAQLPTEATAIQAPPRSREVSWLLVVGALGAGAVAGGAYAEALYSANQARTTVVTDMTGVNQASSYANEAQTFQAVAIAGAAVSLGLVTWAIVDWWRSGETPDEKTPARGSVSVFPAPGGGMLRLRGSF